MRAFQCSGVRGGVTRGTFDEGAAPNKNSCKFCSSKLSISRVKRPPVGEMKKVIGTDVREKTHTDRKNAYK